ncbi:hypothetical protein [Streptomyces chryseus]|uniref:hypothetical protein n=1 Tax=Streptomyces chryseus TaxID=68186 RepID=UPI00110F9229|nr:hypothetical protein [Streptomyces chryseus]GGX35173.1 hypothetical protein GCM10010353_57770 [Streptomyces chryseus]
MPSEVTLLESRTLRDEHLVRVDVLDKVKALVMLPDGIHMRTEDVARYFEVSTEVLKKVVQRHRAELNGNGLQVLRGDDLRTFHRDILSLWGDDLGTSYPQAATQLTVFTRRTVLNVAMLLRDSDIARCVRTYLLDAEENGWRAGYASLDRRVTKVETHLDTVGRALQELGPVINGISVRLDRLDRRLDATNQVVGALSNRLCDLSDHMRRMEDRIDRKLDDVSHRLSALERGQGGRRRKRR